MICLYLGNKVINYIRYMHKVEKQIIEKAWTGPYLKLFGKEDAACYFQCLYSCM